MKYFGGVAECFKFNKKQITEIKSKLKAFISLLILPEAKLYSYLLPTKTFSHSHSNQQIHLCITGGEPLLSKDTWKVIDELIENPNKDFGVCTHLF